MNIDEVIEKIKKAVRLANRTTSAGERETAMRLAKRLAENNGVSFEAVAEIETTTDDAKKCDDDERVLATGPEVGYACTILREHFAVILMFTRRGLERKCTTSWFGCGLNIAIAKQVFHILMRESRKAYAEETRQKPEVVDAIAEYLGRENALVALKDKKISRADFMRGFFYAINKTLTEHPIRNDLDQLAAEKKAAEKKFEDFKNANNVRQSGSRGNRDKIDTNAVIAGMQAGSGVNLSRPCTNTKADTIGITMN